MAQSFPARDFYDLNPTGVGHSPGDIWGDLPSFGLLPWGKLPGLVITPACDLANHKAETLTYLPIVTISQWHRTVAFLPELLRSLNSVYTIAAGEELIEIEKGFRIPDYRRVQEIEARLSAALKAEPSKSKKRLNLERALAGIRILKPISNAAYPDPKMEDVEKLIGATTFTKNLEKTVTNSFRPDLHFLPPDNQPSDWSAIRFPSVVLFRYPITVPIDCFNGAQDISLADWEAFTTRLANMFPCVNAFADKRPIKLATLRVPYISDLIARLVGLNMRLGSPDLTPTDIAKNVELVRVPKSIP